MKKIVFLAAVCVLTLVAGAQPPAGNAKPGDYYGDKPTSDGAVSIAEIPAKLATVNSMETKVRATVLDVCPMKGCWLKLAVNDSTTAFVKMKDYGFFAPLAIKGKTIILDGEAMVKTTSVEELRHYAQDAKKSKQEIAAINAPKKEISFLASGILVVE